MLLGVAVYCQLLTVSMCSQDSPRLAPTSKKVVNLWLQSEQFETLEASAYSERGILVRLTRGDLDELRLLTYTGEVLATRSVPSLGIHGGMRMAMNGSRCGLLASSGDIWILSTPTLQVLGHFEVQPDAYVTIALTENCVALGRRDRVDAFDDSGAPLWAARMPGVVGIASQSRNMTMIRVPALGAMELVDLDIRTGSAIATRSIALDGYPVGLCASETSGEFLVSVVHDGRLSLVSVQGEKSSKVVPRYALGQPVLFDPKCIGLQNRCAFVSDACSVLKVDDGGASTSVLGPGVDEDWIGMPRAIAAEHSGSVLVVSRRKCQLYRFSSEGEVVHKWRIPSMCVPVQVSTGLALSTRASEGLVLLSGAQDLWIEEEVECREPTCGPSMVRKILPLSARVVACGPSGVWICSMSGGERVSVRSGEGMRHRFLSVGADDSFGVECEAETYRVFNREGVLDATIEIGAAVAVDYDGAVLCALYQNSVVFWCRCERQLGSYTLELAGRAREVVLARGDAEVRVMDAMGRLVSFSIAEILDHSKACATVKQAFASDR